MGKSWNDKKRRDKWDRGEKNGFVKKSKKEYFDNTKDNRKYNKYDEFNDRDSY